MDDKNKKNMPIKAKRIFNIKNPTEFNELALEIFHFQYENNIIYQKFVDGLKINPKKINHYSTIPFLPIEFFKTQKIISSKETPEITFISSGTTGINTSKHYVADTDIYYSSFLAGFKHFYGYPEEWVILALLPAYLERSGSSLVYMCNSLIKESNKKESGFYLNEYEKLHLLLTSLRNMNQKTIIIGVTFALLDMAEEYPVDFPNLVVMETGGMKGRRNELIRNELHEKLQKGFGVKTIHSEYGMTELLSQAYSKGDGVFQCPPWMKVVIRDVNDPLTQVKKNKTGGVNVIDLANINSCSFIATQDLGKVTNDNDFEIIGRFDNSDVRGCNLLVV